MPVVRSGNAEIHYEVRGQGPPLVLLVGAGGDRRIWELAGYVAGLSDFRLLLVDPRGRGGSSRPDRLEDHRIERYAEDVGAVLDHEGIDAAGIWGYSNGVLVALAFASAAPERLRALVGTGALSNHDLADLPYPEDPEAFVRRTVEAGGVRASLEAFMAAEQDRFPDALDRNVRESDPRMHALSRLAWRSWHGPKSLLAGFQPPVLVITGALEDPEGETEAAIATLPHGEGVRLPGRGHLAAFYRSDLALPVARPFLHRHLGSPGVRAPS